MFQTVFHQEANLQTFGRISVDTDEVHGYAPGKHCNDEQRDERNISSAALHKTIADEQHDCHVDPVSSCTVHLQAGMTARE